MAGVMHITGITGARRSGRHRVSGGELGPKGLKPVLMSVVNFKELDGPFDEIFICIPEEVEDIVDDPINLTRREVDLIKMVNPEFYHRVVNLYRSRVEYNRVREVAVLKVAYEVHSTLTSCGFNQLGVTEIRHDHGLW